MTSVDATMEDDRDREGSSAEGMERAGEGEAGRDDVELPTELCRIRSRRSRILPCVEMDGLRSAAVVVVVVVELGLTTELKFELGGELGGRVDADEGKSSEGRTRLLKKFSASTWGEITGAMSEMRPRGKRSESLCFEEAGDEQREARGGRLAFEG